MHVLRRSVRRGAARSRRAGAHLIALAVALLVALPLSAAASAPAAAQALAPADDGILKVLLFYKPNFHASHVEARAAVNELADELATEHGETLEVQETDDPAAFTTENLADKDALVFAQTGGVLFDEAQRAALEAYIRDGGGFMGLHYTGWSVGQSEHDVNPFYARLVGAMSEGHPEDPAVRPGRVVVKDTAHPLTDGMPAEFTRSDEWYDWTVNPAPNVRTLLEADETSYGMGRQGTSHPITWCQEIDAGRSWYTGMGHEGSAYSEPVMRTQMRNGLAYAAGLVTADCSPPEKAEHGAWSGVTPWPLVPINMSLTSDGKVQSFGSVGGWGNDSTPYDWTGNSTVTQGGQTEIDVWDPEEPRTIDNVRDGVMENTTYTDLFCSMQVQDPQRKTTMTVGGDDSLGGNAPNDAAIGVTSYATNTGLQTEAPMNFPRWYPTGTTMPDGDIVVQGGSLRGGPGGPGVLTPEVYTPDEGSGWRLLEGATSSVAYGDGGSDHEGQDENRWWYPRAFVTPGSGTLFNISGTQMFELDPSDDGELTLRGTLPGDVADQGDLGNPVGATSTAAMYRPGKILQVGGGWWANGGGPSGARAGFTVDVTGDGGTANPAIEPTAPMEHQRHWPTATMLPDGDVMVTGGSRDNNGNGGYVTEAEIWDPDTGEWTTVDVPHEHARLYHSTAMLLPDGRVMIGGGGTPGPRNYTDVEYYSPSYLFDGNQPAERPEITSAPKKIGYDGAFDIEVSDEISRVTLVRNGSVTHGFNNDQNFQDLEFSQESGSGSVSITAPKDGTYAPPGSYMLFAFDADGTPSVASIVDIDPEVAMDQRTPKVVDQFEYPRLPDAWRSANLPNVVDVAAGSGRMAPWAIDGPVQLVRGTAPSNGGLGLTGHQLALGDSGDIQRTLKGLDSGQEYRISMRYARDSRSPAGDGDATAQLSVGSLDTAITATTDTPSQSGSVSYDKFVGTFTASKRSEALRLTAPGTGAGLMIDDLVVISSEPGVADVPVHYEFEEGSGSSAANTGTDASVGAAALQGESGWSPDGVFGSALDMPGGDGDVVDLPDDLLEGATDFSVSLWANADELSDWTPLFQIGNATDSYFQIQSDTQTDGPTGLAATFKAPGDPAEERVLHGAESDLTPGEWSHVAFTREGSVGTLYLDGEPIASRDDLTIGLGDIGSTVDNLLGKNGFPDAPFAGTMDDVRAYTSALSAADVAGLYADGSAVQTTTTVAVDPASPSPFAEPVTVSTAVAGADAEPAEGRAELWVDGARLGEPLDLVDGSVTFPELAELSPGDHDIEVRYLAADGWRDSATTITHTVERPPPGEGVPIHYSFDEGEGTSAANTGTDPSVGAATLTGSASWTQDGQYGAGLSLPGGPSGSGNQVELPDNIDAGMDEEFTVSVWARPDALPNWVPLVQIGSSTDTFFLLQSSTQANGPTGFAATFKAPGNPAQERLTLGGDNDLPLSEWTHVVFTMRGSTGKIYFDGQLQGTRTDFSIDIGDVGVGGQTTMNLIGGTSWPDARFDGLVDDFRMYGYELSAEQVQELHEGTPDNTAPEGVDDSYSTDENVPLTVDAPGVLSNDSDAEGDPLTATDVTQPANGAVAVEEDGSFTYTPEDGFSGTDTFTYRADDGTATSEPATVTITVNDDDPELEPTEISGSTSAFTYGTKGRVAVTVTPSTASGDVKLAKGPRVLATGTLADGETRLVLPAKSLRPGQHDLRLRYVGDDTHESSQTTLRVVVQKVVPTMKVKAPKKVKRGKRAKVKVTMSAANDVPVFGKVRVKVKGGKSVTRELRKGKVKLRLPTMTKVGKRKVKVVYLGSPLAERVVRKIHIRVRR